jgi:hypothetical protein
MEEIDDRLLKRFTVLKNLEYYIQESVYYRSFSDDINISVRKVLWNYSEDSGKISIL